MLLALCPICCPMIPAMRQAPHTLSTAASRQPDRVFWGNRRCAIDKGAGPGEIRTPGYCRRECVRSHAQAAQEVVCDAKSTGRQVWSGVLSRKEPAIARSIQMKKSGRPSAILIRIEDSARVTSQSALRGYSVLFCFAHSSSCFTIETYERRQVSTSRGATYAHRPSAKSVGKISF